MSHPFCPGCKSLYIIRIRRTGVLENVFLPLLGLYPWICEDCATVFRIRARRKLRLRSRPATRPATQH